MLVCSLITAYSYDLNIFLLQHKAIGIGHKFNNLDRPLPKIMIQSLPFHIVYICLPAFVCAPSDAS